LPSIQGSSAAVRAAVYLQLASVANVRPLNVLTHAIFGHIGRLRNMRA
jgi:hypothetical protein